MHICRHCGKQLENAKFIRIYEGDTYCNLTCAFEKVKDDVRSGSESVPNYYLKDDNK